MKTIIKDLSQIVPEYPVENFADKNKILFLDIETTGFTARNSNLYLIGVVYFQDEQWHTIQWFAENYEDELQILNAFFEFAANYSFIIHYNGNNFDLPYLLQKCTQYKLSYQFDSFEGVDIYRRIQPYRDLLGLSDLKQKTIEEFLGINRDDPYSGRELISKYHDYVCSKNTDLMNEILLHNEEDLKGMLKVVSMLAYSDLFHKNVRVMKAQASYYQSSAKRRCQEIIMKLRFETPLPKPLGFRGEGCYFSGNGTDGSLKVPLFEEELKYFYSNYKNYYYLPAEDIAMHKSVATFVDKEHRIQATAANCYTRKQSLFLPQWDTLFIPFYKREYRSKDLFFELTDDFKKSRSGFSMYAQHVLQSMLQDYDSQEI